MAQMPTPKFQTPLQPAMLYPTSMDPKSREFFERLQRLSPDVRELFLKLILAMIETIRQAQKKKGLANTVGSERIQQIYRVLAYRKANLETDALTERTIQTFFFLNDMGQTILLFKLFDTVVWTQFMEEMCRQLGHRITKQQVNELMRICTDPLESPLAFVESQFGRSNLMKACQKLNREEWRQVPIPYWD